MESLTKEELISMVTSYWAVRYNQVFFGDMDIDKYVNRKYLKSNLLLFLYRISYNNGIFHLNYDNTR